MSKPDEKKNDMPATKQTPEAEAITLAPVVNPDDFKAELPEPTGEALSESVTHPDDEPKRGRGRPKGSTVKAKRIAKDNTLKHKANAEGVVGTLDLMRSAISNGTCAPAELAQRKNLLAAWEAYFQESGIEPPAWVVVLILSGMYVAPAFGTEPARSKMGALIDKFGAWRLNRRSKKAGK